MNRQKWCPYFKPIRKLHSSHYRRIEVGYLLMEFPELKVKKKVILGTGVDHICNYNFDPVWPKTAINIDVSKDGYIMFYNFEKPLYWYVPGFSDAYITDNPDFTISDEDLDKLWEKQNETKK